MTTINATQGPGGATAINNDSATSPVDVTGSILPDPLAMSGDPGAELAALAVQSGEEQQTVAQAGRDTEEKIEVAEDNQQVADMQKKATDIRTAGIVTGAGMAAEGGCTLAGAFSQTDKMRQIVTGGGKVANGGATIGGAFANAAAANEDANAAAAKSASDQAKGAADDLHDAKKAGGDFISAALDFYREYTSAQASASSAALHRA
jgi:hypothetical protein